MEAAAPAFPSVDTQGLGPDPQLDVLRRQGTAFRTRAPYRGGECWMVTAHDDVRWKVGSAVWGLAALPVRL